MQELLLGFPEMVRRFAAQARASTTAALDFSVGSLFRALAEAQAGVGLWFQWQVLEVLRRSRLSTSLGAEADTWVADFGMTRLPGSLAGGSVVLSRNATGLAAFVPVGATVRTADGTQEFAVVADSTNAAWTGAGYAVAASALGVTVPVLAVTAGAAGNVLAGSVSVLTTAIAGIDAVTNAAPFAGGLDAESDAALRQRFVLFVNSRTAGTKIAALNAVAALRQGLTAVVTETAGSYTVTIDDGSGAPPSSLIQQVFAACDAVRPLGTVLIVQPPALVVAVVSAVITARPGYAKNDLIGPVANALLAYVNGLGIGEALSYARIAQTILNVPGVANAQSIILNSGTADVGGGPGQVVRASLPGVIIA